MVQDPKFAVAPKLAFNGKAKGVINFTTDTNANTGTFNLKLGTNENVDVTVYYPSVLNFTTTDTNNTFVFSDWATLGKTQTAEVFIDKDSLRITLTFWYGDIMTGVFSSLTPNNLTVNSTVSRVALCTWLIKV